MENRADLIALAAFGTDRLWWLICTVNGIIDPTELIAGNRLEFLLLDNDSAWVRKTSSGVFVDFLGAVEAIGENNFSYTRTL